MAAMQVEVDTFVGCQCKRFMQKQRDVRVTVTVRFPLSEVIEAYRHALTPDGGIDAATTINAYLAEYAEGVAQDMAGAIPRAATTSSWELVDA